MAHADAWTDAQIELFKARLRRLLALGFSPQDAEDLAERLHLRALHDGAAGAGQRPERVDGVLGRHSLATPSPTQFEAPGSMRPSSRVRPNS